MNLDTSQKVFEYFSHRIDFFQEEVWVAALTTQLEVIEARLIFRGTVDRCLIHPREIFRFLITQNASSFVLIHNHPSGDPTPSTHDQLITQRLTKVSHLMEIPLVDHVIVSGKGFFSFADRGCLKKKVRLRMRKSDIEPPAARDNCQR